MAVGPVPPALLAHAPVVGDLGEAEIVVGDRTPWRAGAAAQLGAWRRDNAVLRAAGHQPARGARGAGRASLLSTTAYTLLKYECILLAENHSDKNRHFPF